MTPADDQRFGHRLRNARKDRKHTQEAAGALLGGVKQQQVGRWEDGSEKPSWKYAQPLADYLGLDLAALLVILHTEHTGRPNGESVVLQQERVNHLEQAVDLLAQRVDLALKAIDNLGRAE